MSHFAVAVIIPKSDLDFKDQTDRRNSAEAAIKPYLAPFDENIELEPYWEEVGESFWKHGSDGLKLDNPEDHEKLIILAAGYSGTEGKIEDGKLYYLTIYNPKSKWDWYQIGGRWTGMYSDYKPEKDPANIEICNLCNGTGKRNDDLGKKARLEDPNYTCNGCQGTGKCVKWSLADYDGDVLPVKEALEKFDAPFAILTPDGEWHERGKMGWFAMVADEKEKDAWTEESKVFFEKYLDHLVVVVDCHI